ncbi:MAG TPA: competence/damage-inducible protein A [Tepidimicrobium sp.]|nr:competence/damage-inducible protein A [Tepidimicrobium sp.]
MKAEIVSVGTEIIMGSTLNTNVQYITQRLSEFGIDVLFHTSVTDDPELLREVTNIALERVDLIIFTGGLGPTQDDMTKEVVSDTLGLKLVLNPFIQNNIKEYFNRTNRPMPSNNIKQAYLPEDSKFLMNRVGTAPGIYIEKDNKIIILLPGPPREMKTMFDEQVVPLIKRDPTIMTKTIRTRTINTIGIGESALEMKLKDIIDKKEDIIIATYAQEGKVDVKIIVKENNIESADNKLDRIVASIDRRISKYIYSYDNESIEEVVYRKLLEQNKRIAFCESCTGGLITSMFTRIPGASKVFDRGIISYSNTSKMEELNIEEDILLKHGAVSETVALHMAKNLLDITGVDIALSTTGIAGPSGGTQGKPIGLVYIGIATKDNAYAVKVMLNGARHSIQNRAALRAFNELRKIL